MAPSLLVTNDGEAEAQDISVKINGTPIMELDQWKEVRQLGPGGSVRYLLTRTEGNSWLFKIEISWADEAHAVQRWRSELMLAVAGD